MILTQSLHCSKQIRNTISNRIFNYQFTNSHLPIISRKATLINESEDNLHFFREFNYRNLPDNRLITYDWRCLTKLELKNTLSSIEGIPNSDVNYSFPESINVIGKYNLFKGCSTLEKCKVTEVNYSLVFNITKSVTHKYSIQLETIHERRQEINNEDPVDCK